jgi:hypothetical protein
VRECEFFRENKDRTLSICLHKDNKEDSEGNCRLENCPLGVDAFKSLEEKESEH